ncbi:MAG: DUF4177 domain-containing protein [Oscillospiraceae bacterium]|nr:DUF4177 domain-containing protein [Oscillospiraceae bacterium]
MKYEYKTLITRSESFIGRWSSNSFENELNKLGNEGWELVNSFPVCKLHGVTEDVVSIFKRAIL